MTKTIVYWTEGREDMSIQSRHPLAQLYGILRELHSARVIDKTILLSTHGPWKIWINLQLQSNANAIYDTINGYNRMHFSHAALLYAGRPRKALAICREELDADNKNDHK